MKLRRPSLAHAACALLPLLLLAGCAEDPVARCGASASAPCDGDDTFPGLTAEVEIRRDPLGVVHVYGATDADVSFGSGYAQATERLFEMDMTRRRALGRRAEVLGPDVAGDDELIRTVGVPKWGRVNAETVRAERPDLYALIVAWTAGVNRRIEEVRSGAVPLPYGFGPGELDYLPEPWEPADGVTVGKMILFGNASIVEFEILASIIRDYLPEVAATPVMAPLEPAFVMPPDERPAAGNQPLSYARPSGARPLPGALGAGAGKALPADAAERLAGFVRKMEVVRPGGSNNLAIDGPNTASGRPIIAGDPHQQLESPSLMWVHHMNSADRGGNIDLVGFAFVGAPGVQLGHNRHVAWTATTNYPDAMDLWGVVVDGGVAHLGGEEVPVEARTEEIVVRGEGTRSVEVVEVPGRGVLLPVGISPLPIVPAGQRLLLGWTGFAPTHDIEGFFGMGAAQNLDDMEAAVDKMETANFNFVSASADGISYRSSPSVPDRGAPSDAYAPHMVLDGADPSTLWTGDLLPLDRMPHSRGGARGWITSANNDPFGFTSDASFVGDPYYFGVFFDPGTRAARIESEIEQRLTAGPLTVEDVQAIQTDTYSRLADRLVPLLEQIYATVDTDDALIEFRNRPELAQLVADLAAWDRRMLRSSSAALAYHAFMSFLTKRAVGDDFGLTFDAIQNASPIYMFKFGVQAITGAYDGSEALLQEGGPLLVMQALDDTAAFLTARFGSTEGTAYTWADHHVTTFDSLWGDALAGGSVPTDGSDGCVNVSAAPFFAGAEPAALHESHAGSIYRMVATFDDDGVPRATINYPRGNSGDPASPHWDDTLGDWVEGRYATLLFRTSEVEAESTVEHVLAP